MLRFGSMPIDPKPTSPQRIGTISRRGSLAGSPGLRGVNVKVVTQNLFVFMHTNSFNNDPLSSNGPSTRFIESTHPLVSEQSLLRPVTLS